MLDIVDLEKSFTLHNQNGAVLNVLERVSLNLEPGELTALCGPSGVGKSSLLKAVYGTYRTSGGSIFIDAENGRVDISTAEPNVIARLRRTTIGYVSQFLRVIPRVAALDIVAEPAIEAGGDRDAAYTRAVKLLERLRIPEALYDLSPLTFSGGEQQRINIARAMAAPRPLMLFDEPTASLDPENRKTVLEMIAELRDGGAAVLGIFHDPSDRAALDAGEFELRKEEISAHA